MVLFLLPLSVLASGVVINEVLFDPADTDTGQELVEIYNSGNSAEDLSGWQLYPDGIGYFLFPQGFSLPAGGLATIHLRSSGVSTAVDLYHSSTTANNMGNVSGSAVLFSGEPRGEGTIKSFVQWGRAGETWETDAEKAGLWTKGTFVDLSSGFSEGGSIALKSDGVVSGGKDAWKIAASPTIGSKNNNDGGSSSSASSSSVSTSSTGSVSNQQNTNWASLFIPQIRAYAGEDKSAVVGSLVEFNGSAFGLKDEPLDNARFWWNFGDGEDKEGRSVWHIFRIPGDYTVGLHVSSGGYSASDYLKIKVLSNQLTVKEVISGESGFIKITNLSDMEIDIGGWLIKDSSGKSFQIPPRTKIGGRAEIALINSVTYLNLDTGIPSVRLFYPNSVLALEYVSVEKQIGVDKKVDIPGQNSASISRVLIGQSTSRVKDDSAVGPISTNYRDLDVKDVSGVLDRPDALGMSSSAKFLIVAFVLAVFAAFSYIFFKKRR